jgi:hypothetical protein
MPDPDAHLTSSDDPRGRIRILAIAGTGQNGSTLVSRLVGELPGFVAIGEVGRLWDKGLIEGVECSCGAPVRTCPFWSEVGRVAFGGWDRVDARRATDLRESLVLKDSRFQHPFALPFLLAPNLWPAFRDRLREYQALMSTLYEAIHEVSEGRIIVDAMKIPAHVYMLSGLRDRFDLRYLHLVRDSRGVANSNAKVVERQGTLEDRPYRGQRGPVKSAVRWSWFNLSSEVLAGVRRVPMDRIRYEDVVRDPAAALLRIAERAGVHIDDDLAFLHGREVQLSSGHLVAGNRMRLQSGPITIAEDDAWRRDLPERSQRIVTTLTWPLLRHYGHLPSARP